MNEQYHHITDLLKTCLIGAAIIFLPISMLLCHSAIIGFLFLWVCEGQWREKFKYIKTTRSLQLFLLLSTIIIIGFLYSSDWSSEQYPLSKKIFLFVLPIAIGTSSTRWSALIIRKFFLLFCVSCFIITLMAIALASLDYYRFISGELVFENIDFLRANNFFINRYNENKIWAFFTYAGLSKQVHLHPTYLSMYLAACCIFLLNDLQQHEMFRFQHRLQTMLLLIFVISIVLLSTRIVMAAMLLIIVGAGITNLKKSRLGYAFLCLILLVIFAVAIGTNPVSRYRGWTEVSTFSRTIQSDSVYNNSTSIRASLWYLAIYAYRETNLIWGTGTIDVVSAMKQQSHLLNITNILDNYDPHSQVLYYLIGNGLIGVLTFVALFANFLWQGIRWRDFGFIAITILFGAIACTESVLELQKGIVFFSLFFPIIIFHQIPAPSSEETKTFPFYAAH